MIGFLYVLLGWEDEMKCERGNERLMVKEVLEYDSGKNKKGDNNDKDGREACQNLIKEKKILFEFFFCLHHFYFDFFWVLHNSILTFYP